MTFSVVQDRDVGGIDVNRRLVCSGLQHPPSLIYKLLLGADFCNGDRKTTVFRQVLALPGSIGGWKSRQRYEVVDWPLCIAARDVSSIDTVACLVPVNRS